MKKSNACLFSDLYRVRDNRNATHIHLNIITINTFVQLYVCSFGFDFSHYILSLILFYLFYFSLLPAFFSFSIRFSLFAFAHFFVRARHRRHSTQVMLFRLAFFAWAIIQMHRLLARSLYQKPCMYLVPLSHSLSLSPALLLCVLARGANLLQTYSL